MVDYSVPPLKNGRTFHVSVWQILSYQDRPKAHATDRQPVGNFSVFRLPYQRRPKRHTPDRQIGWHT